MIFATVAFLAMSSAPTVDSIQLGRIFHKGEKLQYDVKAKLNVQTKVAILEQWIPQDFDFEYKFTTETLELKPDGIAVVRYKRPTLTVVDGETFDSPPKTHIEKTNVDLLLTMSPINEIIAVKDESTHKSGGDMTGLAIAVAARPQMDLQKFVGEVTRLCLSISPGEGSLDLAPRLSLDKVNVGDSWKRTVAYEPQATGGNQSKQAVQRLDFTYVYKGIVDDDGKKVYRVSGSVGLDTDLGDFLNQANATTPAESGLKKFPLTMKATIDFDLDVQTMRTIKAALVSEGGFKVFTFDDDATPSLQQTFKGATTMTLVGKAN